MRYERFEELPGLIANRMVSRRPHPLLPIDIYNYTAQAQHTPVSEWGEALSDCRGLILDREGNIVGRPFRKFWNIEQVQDRIPANESFTVWEKMDGSLGIVCAFQGEIVCATRGSFESDQAKWFAGYMRRKFPYFYPDTATFLFEIIYPENRIVVDYGDTKEAFLLAVMGPDGGEVDTWHFNIFHRAGRFDGLKDFSGINENPKFAGQEGFVVRWESGFRAKVKLEEYKRLHRLITQCSTRTIWEMLRAGEDTAELIDRVPKEFAEWVIQQVGSLKSRFREISTQASMSMNFSPAGDPRKEFAMWAKNKQNPKLLFALLDKKDITDMVWKMIEPKWATPFRKGDE